MGGALLIPFFTSDLAWPPLLMGPLLAFLIGWSGHNAVSYDSDALWLHVAAGTSGTDDRRGRVVPDLLLALLLGPAYTLVGIALTGRWELGPAAAGVSVALLGAGVAVSAVMSVALPYPVPEPGAGPFGSPPEAAGIAIAAQSVASVTTLLVSSPALLLAAYAWGGSPWAVWGVGAYGRRRRCRGRRGRDAARCSSLRPPRTGAALVAAPRLTGPWSRTTG